VLGGVSFVGTILRGVVILFLSLAAGVEFGCKWQRWGGFGCVLRHSLWCRLANSEAAVIPGVYALVLAESIGWNGGVQYWS
jgi:hypothetical protein